MPKSVCWETDFEEIWYNACVSIAGNLNGNMEDKELFQSRRSARKSVANKISVEEVEAI